MVEAGAPAPAIRLPDQDGAEVDLQQLRGRPVIVYFYPGFGDPQTAELLGWPARVARMVEVEAALGAALGRVVPIPREAGEAIAVACERSRLDLAELAAAAAAAPTPVIPLVRALGQKMGSPGMSVGRPGC